MNRVAVLALALVTLAAPAGAQTLRVYTDTNSIGIASLEAAHTETVTTVGRVPIGASAVAYPVLPTISGVQIDAGVRLAGHFGAGVRVSPVQFSRDESTIRLTSDSGPANSAPLQRKQRVVDLSAVYFLPIPARWSIRLFGGPSFFKVSQHIDYTHTYTAEEVNMYDLVSFSPADVGKSVVGIHLGGDVAYFFTSHVGLGGVLSVSRGTADVIDTLSFKPATLDLGQLVLGAGVRFRL